MAKFRFPGKALKLNTRKRVRFRGSHAGSTPEELYTRRIRKGLDLFTQIFGESDEDEDGFEGFSSVHPEPREVKKTGKTVFESSRQKGGKRSAQKVEDTCAALEGSGLITRRRTCVAEMAVRNLRENVEKRKDIPECEERTDKEVGYVESVCDSKTVAATSQTSLTLGSDKCSEGTKTSVVATPSHVTRKQANHRLSRPPTVKTALAKKLLAKAKKKAPSLPVVGEKSPKRFILPTMSVRSSRIIKPNKRLFADITEMCSTSSSLEAHGSTEAGEDSISVPSKRLVKLTRKGRGSHTQFLSLPRSRTQSKNSLSGMEGVGRDSMRRTISLYTESMTGTSKGQVGRPPKRLLRRLETPQQDVEAEVPDSPQRCDPKESRVKEKIEKLLRSPWDDRLKQSGKVGKAEDELMPAPATNTSPALSASVISRNILRKARLNLNKTTLQKIRNPASLQRLIPQCDEGSVEGKCATCDIAGGNSRKFGIVFCEVCSSFLRNASDGPREIFECQNSKGECQIQGLVEEDRCLACWLYRILLSCSMPNLLHDRLRKRLPNILKEQIPTSLARCMSIGGLPTVLEKDAELASHTKRLPLDPGGGGAFGSVMDLPGGWRRKTGPEVIVISPSGEKFKSVQKLEEFLKKQGISTDARVLFGNNSPAIDRSTEVKSRPSGQTNSSGRGKVVMTTLPGGWTRRIKWRSAGDRFDTYVYSPDGRTFRSRRELSAHFQLIGKVDDIHKYFPVVTGHSDASVASSSDTPGSSSTEPVSSSEPCSEVSSDDKSPEASECEAEQPKFKARKSDCNNEKSKFSHVKQLKTKTHKEQGRSRSKSVSKLKTTDISEEPAGQLNTTDVTNEVKNLERKHKKTKMIMRSRSLSVGRKKKSDDASLTDTTESESEQRKSGASTIFSKAFSRNRSKTKPKTIDSQLSLVENSLTTSIDAPVQRFQELNDAKTDTAVELEDVAKRLDTPDEGFKELCNTKTDVMEIDAAKKSPCKKHKKTAEETSVFIKPNVISSEKQLDHKIVLKIPKKAIKPVGKKHRNRNKRVESDCLTVGGDDKGVTEHLKVQDDVEVEKKQRDRSKHGERDSTTVVRDDKGAVEQPSVKDATEVMQDVDQGLVAQICSTNKSFDGTQGKQPNLVHEDPVDVESDSLVGYMSVDSKISSPNASEGEAAPDAVSVPEIKSKPKTKRLSSYETCHFGNGWSRKIRWNERGEGKVALLHSPDSQTFRSRIELLAYFKKAGRSKVDLDLYFPPDLKREQTSLSSRATKVGKLPSIESSSVTAVTSTSAQSSEMSEFSDSETIAKTSEDSSISGEESKRPSIPKVIRCFRKVGGQSALKSIPENVSEESTSQNQVIKISGSVPVLSDEARKPLSQLSKNGRKVIIVSTQEGKSSVKTETEDAEGTVNESGGPRVKHVCRSQAQVLGIPRALFPSPKKEEDRLTGIVSVPSTKGNQKRKIVTVTTTASGKVLRKTQWCSKCPGCTTPNCLKCVNCLDMKKYGGPGTKKKPCVMRKCHNPRLSVKSAISQESTTKVPHQVITTTVSSPTTVKEARKVPVINVKVQEDKIELPEASNDSVSKSLQQEKGVFIPRHVTRTQPDQKDRGDIAAGKQFVPGTLVNIDYWQGYDADEMMLTGYPVTTASSLHPQILCFRCGSVGKEQLLYCAWCCEGIHPYCLEDGEGPESEMEEVFWICRRCAVCHVCGAPGADSLLRCSDCRNYYHMECLGPSAHSTCQPTPDRPWKCVTCTRCTSCGSPNVGRWQKVPIKVKPMEVTMGETSLTTDLALCARCITLRERGNFCPLCNGCYEDDDYDAKMMECGRCGEWIHAHCEGLNNERYQILSFLPDTVEYVCRNCVVDTASSWLDAVGSELLAGCEAVLQALLSSRCAKHLVKREACKVSSSGGLTPLPSLPAVGTPSLERSEDAPLEKMEYAESLVSAASSKRTVPGESLNTPSSESYQSGKLIHSGRNSTISTETGANYSLLETEGVGGSSSINQMGISVDNMDVNSSQNSCKSTKCALETDKDFESPLCSVNINVMDIPQDESSELSKLTGKQVLCSDYSQHEITAAISDEGKGGCITDAKDKIDVKGKPTKDKCGEDVRIPTRRQTRTSSAGVTISSYAAMSSASTDPIKLKECSVRLQDICKSKSPSSSPVKTQSSEQNTAVRSEAETCKETEPVKSQEVEGTNVKPIRGKALECLQSLGEKEFEGVTRETLPGIMSLKDTDVSCTQVDGPNDETTATARVIRTLLFEDRSQMMLGTTGLLESKNENNEEKNLTHVETQLISPKDKITKDIDDDCVSSEESSFCDTDTEIESIQDDPEEPRDLLSVKEKLKDRKYDSVLQFHVDMIRVIENGRHLNRSQTRNVQATYAKHMKECFPWFDVKTANVFELVDKQRPFPIPHTDHNYIFRTLISGSRHFTMRDAPVYRKRSTSPLKGALLAPPDRRKCVLCGRESDDDPNAAGRLLYLGQDEWLHVNCGLWSSEVYEEVDGSLQNVYLAVSRGRLIKCSACLERGATVGCCHKSCQATYHFLCARRSCCQFMEDKRIFCPHHESPLNGEEKSDDFKVSRCVYVDMDSEKKKWKQVPGDRVRITIGSLTIKNLGRIIPESDSVEALIPVDFTCSRLYWSTVDPSKRVTYTCRTRRVVPALDDVSLMGDAAFHKTIDHSLGEETVHKEMAAVTKWFKQLEERKVERKSRETNIIPPHLCPLYRSIRDREEDSKIVESVVRCHTPPAIVELDVQQCIDDIIDKVSRSVEEESLLLDTDLPAIVSADDNELISMVLNDLDACDPITLQSTPSTSGRPSPLDIDFLSTCDHMMDSGKVTHSGNMTQEAQETDCNPQVIMDTTLAPCRNPTHVAYQVESTNADIKEPLIETISPPSTQDLGPVPSCSMPVASNGNTQSSAANDSNSNITNSGNSCNRCSSESKSDSTSCSSSSESSSSSNTARESSSPERCSEGVMSNTSSPDTCSRASSENNTSTDTTSGSTDSNSGSETSSQSTRCITKSPCTSASGKNSTSLKQICRVLPMPSTNSRRSSSASDHSDSLGQTGPSQSPPTSQQSPRHSDENEGSNATGRGSERKKICMKRNYKTVIKKYPLRSGMRKSKPYETVQIEINETIEIPGGEGSGVVHKSLKRKWSGILDSEEENCQKDPGSNQDGQGESNNHGSDGENSKENSVSKKVLKFSDDNNDITVSIVNNNNNLCEFSKSRGHRYRHKTVLQLDGAADGSSSSAEMSESQDEGMCEEKLKSQNLEDPQTPPLHSALAMRIKEQSLARSSPGEEGPYKCSKCKRLYRTKESYEKHIETCTFEVDSSSTSEDDDDYEEDIQSDEELEENDGGLSHPHGDKDEGLNLTSSIMSTVENSGEFPSHPPEFITSQVASEDSATSREDPVTGNSASIIEHHITENPLLQVQESKTSTSLEASGNIKTAEDEPTVKKPRLDSALPRQPGVHRQVRTAIKKCPGSGEDVELLQVVRGHPPPGTDVFVPPPVSPVKFSPIVKKSASPRRYTNIRLMRGSRGDQYRRAAPHMPTPEHYHSAGSGMPMAPPATPAPIQVTMHAMANTSGQILTQGAPASFQQFGGQSTQYPTAAQLNSPVSHLSPALQVAPQVTSQVAPQVSPQVSPQVLTMVSASSVAVPQGYTLQYVGSFRDGEMASGGGSLVTYPTAPVVVPQPQLVMTPQQSSVVVPQVVNTNITYSFTAPETLVINQPAMVPGMQSVQYLPQQQQQQQQQHQQQQPQVMHHTEQQVSSVMQYNESGVSTQHTQVPVSHIHSGQVHSPCIQFSDLQAGQVCMQQQHHHHQQPQPAVVSRELSFTCSGSKQLHTPQCIVSSPNRGSQEMSVNVSPSSSIGSCSTLVTRQRPQASVAPQVIRPQPVHTTASPDSSPLDAQGHSRLPFADRPLVGGVRTVATVAPAVITTSSVVSISTCNSTTKLTSVETSPKIATVRPRPTYSYRDAMREKQLERQKQRQEMLQMDKINVPEGHPEFLKEQKGLEILASESETDSESEITCQDAEEKDDRIETQSYKLVLRKDSSLSSGFNVLPISGPAAPLPSPEVKELRIKAKVSVGPKRKKAKNHDPEKDLIIVNKDTASDLYVNEQLPNFSINPMHNPADDPAMFEKPKTCSSEPYIVFELTSEDGFRVESRHISEVWQKVFDAVAAARASMRIDSKMPTNLQQAGPGGTMSGLHMLGLTHNAVQYLLEQLPGAKDCHKYSFQFHRRPQEEGAVEENPTGCARTEPFKTRSPYDIFSWLASKHRRMPERSLVQQEEIQLSTTRRATSLELPMAMRYRHLRETAREAVGVFRSSIHGRGLFCKRDIDAGEMVIEYAGQVIRSSLCDMREKDYESKGIGCYMFRIDDDTVIDATMHGNAARFINHSCDPNCYSRVVDILGKKHIIIFALRRILRGEELTYDYKFPIEEDKIPCTCGTRRCRKYLN